MTSAITLTLSRSRVNSRASAKSSSNGMDNARARPRPRASIATMAKKQVGIDRTTGYIESDNTASGNIFAIEPKTLYTESPTSDKYAKKGLGGVGGVAVACAVIGGVAFATTFLNGFEEVNNEFANYNGQPVSYYETMFK